jgi:hypothetical protein
MDGGTYQVGCHIRIFDKIAMEKTFIRHITLKITLLTLILALAANIIYAQTGYNITITGTVKDEQGSPIENVKISRLGDDNALSTTDEAGYFQFAIEDDAVLLFSHISYESKQVMVNGQPQFDVVLASFAYDVEEVVFVAKSLKPIVEETDMEIVGDYLYINPRVKLTSSSFGVNMRAIIQPVVTNLATNEKFFMMPRVVDGSVYDIKQKRMYSFDITKDPLHRYRDGVTFKNDDFYVAYNDSIYLRDKTAPYTAFVFISIENLNKIESIDSVNMSNGIIDPLRFLEYDFETYEISDTNYIPKRELQLFDEKWKADFVFKLGRAELDLTNEKNAATIKDMSDRLSAIEGNPFMRLRSFNISGMASPEGSYKLNTSLADKRMKALQNIVKDMIPRKVARFVEFSYDSKVATWSDAVELLEKDSLMEQASEIKSIIARYYKSQDDQFLKIRTLKYYNSLLKEIYLPQLRKVEYSYQYSLYRILNDQEIAELYKRDYKDMTRFEFYRLIKTTPDSHEREVMCRKAIAKYPKTVWFANELCAYSLNHGDPKVALLGIYDPEKLPDEAKKNQVATLFSKGYYHEADSLYRSVSGNSSDKEYLGAVICAKAGLYEDAYSVFKDKYPFNEVLLLLAMKRNEEAWDKAKNLGNTAKELYIKAVAANRLAMLEAYDYIAFALQLDPSLRAIAENDADVKEILADETF